MLSTKKATAGNSLFSFKSNIKNYWSARYSCESNIRNYMSYVNYAATNQIPVSLCIFIDVIIMNVIGHMSKEFLLVKLLLKAF